MIQVVLLFFNFVLMIIMPILLGWWVASRRQVGWYLFGIGAAGFVLSQIFHIPFNWLVLQKYAWVSTENLFVYALFLGLSAGLFEEVTRYLTFRYWAVRARTWGKGLMLGTGWGGIEAIILGGLGFYGLMQIVMLQNNQALVESLPVEQMNLVKAQLTEIADLPWYMFFLGAVERVFAICFHLAASIMILQIFLRKNIFWLPAAVIWHTLLDATAVYVVATWGALEAELVLGIISIFSLAIIFGLKTEEPAEPEPEPLPAVGPAKPVEQELSESALEKSKYS